MKTVWSGALGVYAGMIKSGACHLSIGAEVLRLLVVHVPKCSGQVQAAVDSALRYEAPSLHTEIVA